MKGYGKKLVAPIIVTIILIVYLIIYFGFLITVLDGIIKVLFGIIPVIGAILIVKVCIERINEIKKGEEDDLSQY